MVLYEGYEGMPDVSTEAFQAMLDMILKVAEIVSIVGGGGALLYRIGRMTQKFESIGVQQSLEISELKTGMDSVRDVLVTLANQDGIIKRLEDRLSMQGARLDETTNRVNTYFDSLRK